MCVVKILRRFGGGVGRSPWRLILGGLVGFRAFLGIFGGYWGIRGVIWGAWNRGEARFGGFQEGLNQGADDVRY